MVGDEPVMSRSASADVFSEHPDLVSLVEHPDSAALLIDFDGTLAPIVDNPEDARPLPAAVAALEVLRDELRDVVIVSGRPLDFLRPIVPGGIHLAGLDGLQRSIGGVVVQDPRVRAFGMVVEQVAGEAERLLPGVLVERKSDISVSLHWRTNPVMGETVADVARRLAERHGLHLNPGRMVLELRPAIPIDKGVVSRDFVRGRDHAVFIGDDQTDLVAFESLADLRRSGSLVSLGLVAVTNDEVPAAVTRIATSTVEGPHGVAGLLQGLASALRGAERIV